MSLVDVPFTAGTVEIRGALDLKPTADGLLPRRVPAWTAPQIPDAFMDTVVTSTSGVRLVFRTTSPVVELTAHPMTVHVTSRDQVDPAVELVVDGELVAMQRMVGGTFIHIDQTRGPEGITWEAGGPATVRFDDLGSSDKEVELWLPTHSSIELRRLAVAEGSSVSAPTRPRRRWVHHGSSISHCMDVSRPSAAWPMLAARLAGVDVDNFGFGGQCQLDPFMGRVLRDVPADVMSLKVGINLVNAASMSERTFGPALHGFLDSIRDGHPTTPLLVVSPIYCPSVEDHPGPTVPVLVDGRTTFVHVEARPAVRPLGLTLVRIREMVEQIVGARRAAGDEHLHTFSGLDLFGADDVDELYDRLHPTEEGYRRIGERFAAKAFGPGGPLAVRSAT
jgi:hypothetical protein